MFFDPTLGRQQHSQWIISVVASCFREGAARVCVLDGSPFIQSAQEREKDVAASGTTRFTEEKCVVRILQMWFPAH